MTHFLFTLLLIPALLLALLAVGNALWRRQGSDTRLKAALDFLLEKDARALRQSTRSNPLDFCTSEYLPIDRSGLRPMINPGEVEIVRTIRAPIDDGYRIRVRAYLRRRSHVIVRSKEVDLRWPNRRSESFSNAT